MPSSFQDIPSFVRSAINCVGAAETNARQRLTKQSRILRRYSVAEVCEFLDCDRNFFVRLAKHPDMPEGEVSGRERTFSVYDILKMRAVSDLRPRAGKQLLHWRGPNDPIPVIVFSSQKGGTGKSLTTSHFAQGLSLYYGLRVGVIDGDPQATCSQYFVDDQTELYSFNVETYTDFMGLPDPGGMERIHHDAAALDTFWRPTPWPGIRLMPGGASIQEADVTLFFLSRSKDPELKKIYRMLRDNLDRWREAYPARTQAADLDAGDGRLDEDRFKSALTETLDVIVIDTPPSLTITTLNTVVAADSLIVPQTMRGFDLNTLHNYLSNLEDYFKFIDTDTNPVRFRPAQSMVLPTIVHTSNDTDLLTIGELLRQDADVISKVFYKFSSGAANAFREYKSAYEYKPDRNRRESLRGFIDNANAVNDMIVQKCLPRLPKREFADDFINQNYPEGFIEMLMAHANSLEAEDAA